MFKLNKLSIDPGTDSPSTSAPTAGPPGPTAALPITSGTIINKIQGIVSPVFVC